MLAFIVVLVEPRIKIGLRGVDSSLVIKGRQRFIAMAGDTHFYVRCLAPSSASTLGRDGNIPKGDFSENFRAQGHFFRDEKHAAFSEEMFKPLICIGGQRHLFCEPTVGVVDPKRCPQS